MAAFQIIKRTDVPAAHFSREAGAPNVRLHKGGQMFFSKRAAEVLGHDHPLLVVAFDEEAGKLKLMAVEMPPKGLDLEDCFPLRVKNNHMLFNPAALLRHIGFHRKTKESQALEVVDIDAARHTLTVVLPQEQMNGEAVVEEPEPEGVAIGANLEGHARPAREMGR